MIGYYYLLFIIITFLFLFLIASYAYTSLEIENDPNFNQMSNLQNTKNLVSLSSAIISLSLVFLLFITAVMFYGRELSKEGKAISSGFSLFVHIFNFFLVFIVLLINSFVTFEYVASSEKKFPFVSFILIILNNSLLLILVILYILLLITKTNLKKDKKREGITF